MDSSEARSCAVLCTIRIKVAISGNYLLRDVLTSVLMAPPTSAFKKRHPVRAARRLVWVCIIEECFWAAGRCRAENDRGFIPTLGVSCAVLPLQFPPLRFMTCRNLTSLLSLPQHHHA